jgi:hypothetical protein
MSGKDLFVRRDRSPGRLGRVYFRKAVLRIRIRIWIRIHVFLGPPDPDPTVRGVDPDPDLDPSIIMQK